MSWTAETRTGLVTLLARLLEIPVQFRTTPQVMHAGPSATIDILGEAGIGVDEIVYTEGPTPEEPTEVTPTVYGLREATIQVSVWSPSQVLEESARAYIQRLRTRLQWPSADEELRTIGLAIVDIGESIPLDIEQGSRLRSAAALDLRVGFGVAEADAAIPFIEHVRVYSTGDSPDTGDILNAGGVPLPDSAQADAWHPPLPPEP